MASIELLGMVFDHAIGRSIQIAAGRSRCIQSDQVPRSKLQYPIRLKIKIIENNTMKNIPRSILVSLVPILLPLPAFADEHDDAISSNHESKERAARWRASQVMGVDVKTASGETIGEVEDLVLNMTDGKVLAVVISSGGFLGIADTLSTVPVNAMRYDQGSKAFKTMLTKKQLLDAPKFKSDKWPDFSEATSMEALRSYSDMIGGDVSAEDNSAQNEEDIRNHALNPTDQGNSARDLQITKSIRSDIMNNDLSFNAKNIKIITRNEHVTLKGVVESDAERKEILKIAQIHAKITSITDDMKVKNK